MTKKIYFDYDEGCSGPFSGPAPSHKLHIESKGSGKVGTDPPKQKLEVYSGEAKTVGIKDNLPKTDLYVSGIVRRVEEATYDYADIKDEKYNSMLTIPLLKFEGKRVEIKVNIIDDDYI